MSGQLVGEVIAAGDSMRRRGISRSGFMALVAIAEKSHTQTRQASVRWDHICAGLYGVSKRTAQRAVAELKDAGLLRLVCVGYTNQRSSRAPVYEIAELGAVAAQLDSDIAMSSSTEADSDTAMSLSSRVDRDKTEVDRDKTQSGSRQNASGSRHPDVLLDGSIDGSSFDGSIDVTARAAKSDRGHRLPEGWEPPTAVMNELRQRWPLIDLPEALDEFRDFWCGVPGARGRKTDWAATFRNRVRDLESRRLEREQRNNRFGGNGPRLSTADQRVRDIQALKTPDNLLELEA